jgi:hypothetical protein
MFTSAMNRGLIAFGLDHKSQRGDSPAPGMQMVGNPSGSVLAKAANLLTQRLMEDFHPLSSRAIVFVMHTADRVIATLRAARAAGR